MTPTEFLAKWSRRLPLEQQPDLLRDLMALYGVPPAKHEHDITTMHVVDYTPDDYRGPVTLEKTGETTLVVRKAPQPESESKVIGGLAGWDQPEGTE